MKERIAVTSEIHFGKPCVARTRIPVQSVLELVREGMPFAEIIRDYHPKLEPEDIRACIQYAIDVAAAEDTHMATTDQGAGHRGGWRRYAGAVNRGDRQAGDNPGIDADLEST